MLEYMSKASAYEGKVFRYSSALFKHRFTKNEHLPKMKAGTLLTFAASCLLVGASVTKAHKPKYLSVAYWGQGSESNLSDYCTSKEGFDILVLAFLSNFGGGTQPNGYIGDCYIKTDGTSSNCGSLIKGIQTCKKAKKKVFISIGGGGAQWQLKSKKDAQDVAASLWNSYANPKAVKPHSKRPLGDAFVDGWDLDIESNPNNEAHLYLPDLVKALRDQFQHDKDKSNHYYISGAPQCPVGPIPNMDSAIKDSKFDYLFIQYYNAYCAAVDVYNSSANPYGGSYNFDKWPAYLKGTASENAKLLVGLPASPAAANNYNFWVSPSHLPEVIKKSVPVRGFSGVMLWNAGQVKNNVPFPNFCNYAQEVRKVLDTGKTC